MRWRTWWWAVAELWTWGNTVLAAAVTAAAAAGLAGIVTRSLGTAAGSRAMLGGVVAAVVFVAVVVLVRVAVARHGPDPAPDPTRRARAAAALTDQGATLAGQGRSAEAAEAFSRVVLAHADDPTPALREQVAAALAGLDGLGRADGPVAVHGRISTGSEPASALARRVAFARALNAHGALLQELGRPQEAGGPFLRVRIYADDPEPELREQVAIARNNRGTVLAEAGLLPAALAEFEQVTLDYAADPAVAMQAQVVRSLLHQAAVLDELERPDAALEAFGVILANYVDDPEPELREASARARYGRAVALAGLGRLHDAAAADARTVADFGADPNPALRDIAAAARRHQDIVMKAGGRPEESRDDDPRDRHLSLLRDDPDEFGRGPHREPAT